MLSDVATSDVIVYDRGDSDFWRWQYRSFCFLGIGQPNKVKCIQFLDNLQFTIYTIINNFGQPFLTDLLF